ncbi:Zn(II)2Cys6 transcription factor domain-containing protein [Aspergillus undulatus]|uniref:Zn(II)2Cys6 transcription factor domain-containing protein n=1 Tax=Aspergillus undulatus TaxID=1810928 RepID=UPI003CCD61DF
MDTNTKQVNQKIRSRRTHRKSRNGCENCKKRRVKCDEKKPICNNCLLHSIECDFQASSRSPSEGATPPQQFKFRQSKYQAVASPQSQSQAQDESGSQSKSIAIQCDTPSLPTGAPNSNSGEGISLLDLRLFHHFTTSTYRTLADETATALWQTHVPQWGLTFHSILHLLLTLSALHLSWLYPHSRESYIRQADQHFAFGVRSVTSVLALDMLDSNNCQHIYIAAVMICFAYFARGPRDGEYLVFNAKGKSEWLVLLHGVRAILAQKQSEIFTGVLAPTESTEKDQIPGLPPPMDLSDEFSRHFHQLEKVKAMISTLSNEQDKALYTVSINDLVGSFEGTYQDTKAGKDPTGLMVYIMGWTFRQSPSMIDKLEAKDPIALVILAHWAILLRFMQRVWFMRGWDRHIFRGIRACLSEAFHAWIEWPEEVVGFV